MKYRWLVLALALLAASALAISVQAGRWWTIGDVAIGPFGSRSSFAGAGDLSWLGGGARWQRFAIATWAGGMIAMFVLLVVAAAAAANRVPRLAAMTALVALATATLVGIGFIVGRPDSGMVFAAGRGLPLFGAGIVTGVAAVVLVLRSGRGGQRARQPAARV